MKRRDFLKGAAAAGAAMIGVPRGLRKAWAQGAEDFGFAEIAHGLSETHLVPEGYRADVLIRWGDPVLTGKSPAIGSEPWTAEAQKGAFGFNNDFIAYFPLSGDENDARRGLLCVNHEYAQAVNMFPGGPETNGPSAISRERVEAEMAAHGHTVVEVRKAGGGSWSYLPGGRYSRRITPETPMRLSGPAAGDDRLKTSADPSGTEAAGTLSNCAGGKTPWGTVLIAEENFDLYFHGDPSKTREARNHGRLGVGKEPWFGWSRFFDRFDLGRELNEANRFGWIVEFDPYDPKSVPVKRTALGRLKHEGAAATTAPDGRVVVFSGDDQRFEHVYRFVSSRPYNPKSRPANAGILDEGTLSAARFDEDGSVKWLPLIFGEGPLTEKNGFRSQADVLIEARHAASLLGATRMDRPEDVEANPRTGRVYLMLTKNKKRTPREVDAANPRARNLDGQVIEMTPPSRGGAPDPAAPEFKWDLLIRAGDPAADRGAAYGEGVTPDGWFANPDNCAFDKRGRLWIATDGMTGGEPPLSDGLYAVGVDGPGRGVPRHFFNAPAGAEVCGPEFTPDGKTLFLSVQHPGGEGGAYDRPSTRWPDFKEGVPPKPSVLAVTREDGGEIG